MRKLMLPPRRSLAAAIALGILLCLAAAPAFAADEPENTSIIVLVTDAASKKPIFQARLTLQFREQGNAKKLKLGKLTAFSAKTNAQGRYRFTEVPMGKVRLIVTAEHHQTFSKDFEITKADQLLEVTLRKPQPLL